jgi:hypothetical protein
LNNYQHKLVGSEQLSISTSSSSSSSYSSTPLSRSFSSHIINNHTSAASSDIDGAIEISPSVESILQTSDIIHLKGMRFFAHHGVYQGEKELGQPFIVDLQLYVDVTQAGKIISAHLISSTHQLISSTHQLINSSL